MYPYLELLELGLEGEHGIVNLLLVVPAQTHGAVRPSLFNVQVFFAVD